jgi:GDP/UDP-N,N'-diacetylbacillosamine 2-epimerase (hydrolysing)
LDNIHKLKLLTKDEFEKSIDFGLGKKNLLVTFHPVTLEQGTAKEQFQQLLNALDNLEDTHIIFTKANADTDGRVINAMIDRYVLTNTNKSIAFSSLGQLRYLSALAVVDAVVGNSSSGLIEAPSFKIGTINIGDRQKGRIKSESIIDCQPNSEKIGSAICRLYSSEFQQKLLNVKNPYGEGGSSQKIAGVLSTHSLTKLLKKKFIDLLGAISNE